MKPSEWRIINLIFMRNYSDNYSFAYEDKNILVAMYVNSLCKIY